MNCFLSSFFKLFRDWTCNSRPKCTMKTLHEEESEIHVPILTMPILIKSRSHSLQRVSFFFSFLFIFFAINLVFNFNTTLIVQIHSFMWLRVLISNDNAKYFSDDAHFSFFLLWGIMVLRFWCFSSGYIFRVASQKSERKRKIETIYKLDMADIVYTNLRCSTVGNCSILIRNWLFPIRFRLFIFIFTSFFVRLVFNSGFVCLFVSVAVVFLVHSIRMHFIFFFPFIRFCANMLCLLC